ncbi:MAG: amidohydrolase family protein [Natronomonas sp.]
MRLDTIISSGKIVTSDEIINASLGISDGQIVAVGDRDQLPEADRTVDASGQLVLPGVVDPHVHVGDHISDDSYETATKAAALGGVTTIIDFAWQGFDGDDAPWEQPGTLREGIDKKRNAAKGEAVVDYTFHAGILREDDSILDEIPEIVEYGIPSFKIFTAYDWGLSNGFIERVMERLAETGAVGLYHTEDRTICEERSDQLKAAGKSDPTSYPESRPAHAEAIAADAAARLAVETGSKYYGVHTSCQAAADVLEQHARDGSIRAETCTHYLALDESVYDRLGSLPRIAPPIRPREDVASMFDHLGHGTLSVVSTDHVAQKAATKHESEWWEGPYGANGLQTSLPVVHQEAVVERDFSYPFLVRVMASNPAQTFGLQNKGTLQPGTDADIVLFDPEIEYTITAEDNASISDHSLYEGMEVSGAVTKTFVRGNLVAEDGEIVAENGRGNFVQRPVPDWGN